MDEDQFRSPTFDAKEYANATLASNSSSSQIPHISAAIDRVQSQIKNLVATHHDQLLHQPTAIAQLRPPLDDLQSRLNELESSLQKLRNKIQVPHHELEAHVQRLDKLTQASELLRRTSRFVMLARRLQAQMEQVQSDPPPHQPQEDGKERTIAKAALTIAQLVALLDAPDNMSIRSVTVVAHHISFIEDARATVTADMQQMVLAGLTNLDHTLLASSLQTAYNLRVLPDLVQSLLNDLSQAVDDRIRSAFDISKISKEAAPRERPNSPHQQPSSVYKSRVRTEPTNLTAPQWTTILWTRLQSMIDEMSACCIKVYTLESVLRLKADAVSNVVLMDEAMTVLENRPTAAFWTALSHSLQKHSRDSTRNSQFLQQTLSTGYPKLLRLFHEFFTKIAFHTDAVYSQNQQSPETVLVLRALTHLESTYLSRSTTKLNEQVAQVFSRGPRSPPTASEVSNFARTIANELDSAKFDPLLLRSITKGAVSGLEALVSRADAQISHDRSAVVLMGPAATPQQITNAEVTNCLFIVSSELQKLSAEHNEAVFGILKPALQAITQKIDEISVPLLSSIRRELDAIINKIHRVDFAKPMDPMSDMGGGSSYMKDLVERLSYIKSEIFSRYSLGDLIKEWTLTVSRHVARSFVLHASIAKPLGESGKLQLTSDMTELEFSLSAFITDSSKKNRRGSMLEAVGSDYRALRGMRQLLFLDNAQLASSQATAGLAPLIVLHHILVRSPIPLPHTLHGWQEAEYVRWIGEHTEREAWTLVDTGLVHWEKTLPEVERHEGVEYVRLARSVLEHARGSAESDE